MNYSIQKLNHIYIVWFTLISSFIIHVVHYKTEENDDIKIYRSQCRSGG